MKTVLESVISFLISVGNTVVGWCKAKVGGRGGGCTWHPVPTLPCICDVLLESVAPPRADQEVLFRVRSTLTATFQCIVVEIGDERNRECRMQDQDEHKRAQYLDGSIFTRVDYNGLRWLSTTIFSKTTNLEQFVTWNIGAMFI